MRSNLDEQIEQLSFGRSVPRLESCLGLFISPDTIFLSEVSLAGATPKVLHLVRLPVPGADDASQSKGLGSLNTEFLADQTRLLALLKKALTDIQWSSKHVMVSLSHHFGILRFFAMPAIDRRFWKTAVPAEAKKYVPIPFATLTHDFLISDLEAGMDKKLRMGSLFGVTHKQNLENIQKLIQSLGLTLLGTELAPCSVERLWDTVDQSKPGTPYAQVHFDGGHVRILISDKGLPIFFREVYLPPDATVMERRKVDLAGCINFTKKQIGSAAPQTVRISGVIGDLGAWRQAFTQDLGRQVGYMDIDKTLGLKGGQWGGYAAVGTALRHLGPTALTLDLSGVGKISDEDRQAAKSILTIAALFSAVFLLMGAFRLSLAALKSRELSAMRSSGDILEEFEGKSSSDIEYMMSDMKKKAQQFGSLTARGVPLTTISERMAELIPEAAWITNLTYSNPVSMDGGGGRGSFQPRTMTIVGKVIDQSETIEQDVAYRFHKALQSDKIFSQAFKSIEIEVRSPQSSRAEEKRLVHNEEQSIKNRLKDATDFTIQCLSRKI